MTTIQLTTCDLCETKIDTQQKGFIELRSLNPQGVQGVAPGVAVVRHLCGARCLEKYASQFIERANAREQKASAPVPASKGEGKP